MVVIMEVVVMEAAAAEAVAMVAAAEEPVVVLAVVATVRVRHRSRMSRWSPGTAPQTGSKENRQDHPRSPQWLRSQMRSRRRFVWSSCRC